MTFNAVGRACQRRVLLCGAVLGPLTLLAAAPAARAAEASDTTSSPTAVETLVVTAQRRSENIQEVPISIQAFTGKDLQNLGVKSSVELGALTPNMDIALVAGPGNQPIITIRGIGLNDYDTNNAGPNGVYVDEVYLSAPGSQSFATFDLDRVEVLKGPQGTLYGRNTSGGAINFVSRKPTDYFTGDLHIEYSEYNTVNIEGAVGGPIAHNLDGRIAFVVNESDGYVHNDLTGNSENGLNNYAVRTQLLWKPTDNFKLLFNVHGGQVNNRPTEYRHIGDFVPGTTTQCSLAATYAGGCVDLFGYGTPKGFYEGAYNRTEHLKVNSLGSFLRADYLLGTIDLTSITAFEHNDKIHPEDSDASPNRLLEINFGVKSNTFTQELRATQSTNKYDWVTGLYLLSEKLQQNQPLFILLDGDQFFGGPGAANGVAFQAFDRSNQITNAYAAYAQGDYKIIDKLKLTLGGRYTAEQKGFDYNGSVQFQEGGENNFGPLMTLANTHEGLRSSAFNYRVGLQYQFTQDIMTYASVASGFKSGDFNGSFLSLVPVEIALQLTPVKPEHVTTYEVGGKSTFFDGRLLFNAAAFYNQYNDLQVFVLVNPPPGEEGGLPSQRARQRPVGPHRGRRGADRGAADLAAHGLGSTRLPEHAPRSLCRRPRAGHTGLFREPAAEFTALLDVGHHRLQGSSQQRRVRFSIQRRLQEQSILRHHQRPLHNPGSLLDRERAGGLHPAQPQVGGGHVRAQPRRRPLLPRQVRPDEPVRLHPRDHGNAAVHRRGDQLQVLTAA